MSKLNYVELANTFGGVRAGDHFRISFVFEANAYATFVDDAHEQYAMVRCEYDKRSVSVLARAADGGLTLVKEIPVPGIVVDMDVYGLDQSLCILVSGQVAEIHIDARLVQQIVGNVSESQRRVRLSGEGAASHSLIVTKLDEALLHDNPSKPLVFDAGVFDGKDTEYYLSAGFRVVAIEANRQLCESLSARFADQLRSGDLTLINMAVADVPGEIDFFVNLGTGEWSSIYRHVGTRYDLPYEVHRVQAVTPMQLFDKFGVPYYAKIDIERADGLFIDALDEMSSRPPYMSFEAEPGIFDREIRRLERIGYKHFNIVRQKDVAGQRVGSHLFRRGASGPFGSDLKSPWIEGAEAALQAFVQAFTEENKADEMHRSHFDVHVSDRTPGATG